jgi:hypothetical protein
MLSKKVILEVLCIVVLAILVIMQFVPKVFDFKNLIDPTLQVMVKSIECRLLERDVCFLRYPEQGTSDTIITGVIMTPLAFNNYDAYLIASRPLPPPLNTITVSSCKISREQCRFEFKVVDACDGADFCTIHVFVDNINNVPPGKYDDGEAISKDLELTKIS